MSLRTPFSEEVELEHSLSDWSMQAGRKNVTLPGYPRLRMGDAHTLADFLTTELCTPELDSMPLWLTSTPSFDNIAPLHRQKLRVRKIAVMEDPGLHLVWYRNEIFIKPLPAYLLSHGFWAEVLCSKEADLDSQSHAIRAAALGYLRTYAYLIKYQSDFRIAQQESLQLVPADVTWGQFCAFIEPFTHLHSDEICPRFREYGELRYSRLNILVKLMFMRWSYRHTTGQYNDYFVRFFGTFLFVFAILSVMLNAMQVALTVETLRAAPWMQFWEISRWFAVMTMIFIVWSCGMLLLLLMRKFLLEVVFTVKRRAISMIRNRRSRRKTDENGP